MAAYREVTFVFDRARCETVRARLLGMVIEQGDDERRTPDRMTAFYDAGEGGVIVYEVEYCYPTDELMSARLRRAVSLDEIRCDYYAYLERLAL